MSGSSSAIRPSQKRQVWNKPPITPEHARNHVDCKSLGPFSRATLGLIPALSREMRLWQEVDTIFDRFPRDPVIADEARLANFGLHLDALPTGGSRRP
jgi:hypothetical protein